MAEQRGGGTGSSSGRHPARLCSDTSSLLESMDAHRQQDEERRFKCSECGRGYRHAGSLTNHRRTHEVGSFHCSICGKENLNASAMKNHLRSHTSFKKHSCADCGKCFRLAAQLLAHKRIHLVQRSADHWRRNADVGNSTYEKEIDPRLDELSNPAGIPAETPEDAYNSQAESCSHAANRPFRCNLCEKSYIHHRSLINHKKTHQLGMFECTVCFKLCSNMGALYSHQRTHKARGAKEPGPTAGSYSNTAPDRLPPQSRDAAGDFCHLCQMLFPTNTEFQEHIQMHNSSSQCSEQRDVYEPAAASPESGFCVSPVEDQPPSSLTDPPRSFGPAHHGLTPPLGDPQGDPSAINTSGVPASSAEETSTAESDERPFKCQTCGRSYRHSGSLINHRRSHQVGVFQCSVCGKTYPHLAALRSHLRLHKAQRASLHLHAAADWLSPEPLTADGQQGCFYPPHQQTLSPLGVDQEDTAEEPSDQDLLLDAGRPAARHMCADCGETSADIAGIKSHCCPLLSQRHVGHAHSFSFTAGSASENPETNSSHGSDGDRRYNESAAVLSRVAEDDDPDEEDDGDHYQCSVCGDGYATMTALRSHLQAHHDPHASHPPLSSREDTRDDEPVEMTICSTCGETLVDRQDLMAHLLRHETERADCERPVKGEVSESEEEAFIICSSCGVSCSSYRSHGCTAEEKEEMKAGVRPQHEETSLGRDAGERRYKCEQCGRSYRHAGSLLNHKKSHKTGVFRCAVCQKRFYNLLALKNHQRSHFDVKRHSCHECGKAFKIQKQLLNHLRRHKENRAKNPDLLPGDGSGPDAREPSPASDSGQNATVQDAAVQDAAVRTKPADEKRPFSCSQCGRTYRHAGSLVNHRNSHKTGQYYCSICRNTYSNQLAMKNHLRSHFAYKKHLCQKCGKGFRGQKQLLAHVCAELREKRAAGRTGRRPRTVRLSAGRLAAHACDGSSEPNGEEERPFQCNICHRSYRHAGSLLNHKNTHKTGHFSCAFCSKPFSNLMALRNHTRIHTQTKRHACPTCGKAFRLASVLHSHQRVHSQPPSHFCCSSCGKSFQGRSGLERHRCHRGERDEAPPGPQPPETGDKCFTCDLCGRSYRHAGSLLNHKKSHSEDLYQCTLCLQTFPDPLSLQLHSQIRRQSCPECGKTFCVSAHLRGHMEAHSRSQGPVRRLCQQSSSAGYQERHAAQGSCQQGNSVCWDVNGSGGAAPPPSGLVPGGDTDPQTGEPSAPEEKSHVCEHCGRTYRHAGSLLNHKNSHKTGCFCCSVCHKEFTNLMALKNHRRIHTEPKRYQCLTCGKAFRVSTQLMCHRRIHTKEKPFTCQLCSRSFSSKSNLRNHQKMHQNPPQTHSSSFDTEADAFMDLDLESLL
ncbi:uncharacterized protein znf646 [Fundulus diaphanus]